MAGKMLFILLPLMILIISATVSTNAPLPNSIKVNSSGNSPTTGLCSVGAGCKNIFVNVQTVAIGISILVIAALVALISGLNIAGFGGSSETSHIAFMITMFSGIWVFFTGLDGFNPLSAHPVDFQPPNSIFTGLNTIGQQVPCFAGSKFDCFSSFQYGTEFYFLLTFIFIMGVIYLISRGT